MGRKKKKRPKGHSKVRSTVASPNNEDKSDTHGEPCCQHGEELQVTKAENLALKEQEKALKEHVRKLQEDLDSARMVKTLGKTNESDSGMQPVAVVAQPEALLDEAYTMAARSGNVITGSGVPRRVEDLQRDMHLAMKERSFSKASRERCIEKVKQCLNEAPNNVDRSWPAPDTGQSALYHAVELLAFDVYALLLCHGCEFKGDKEKKGIFPFKTIRMTEYQFHFASFAHGYKDAHIEFLKTHSSSKTPRDGFNAEVDRMYRALNSDESLRILLQIAATRDSLRIFFDFDSDEVQCMAALRDNRTLGLTLLERDTIHIAAKRDWNKILGTLAHELCHLALHVVYENEGKPYRNGDCDGEERYRNAIKHTKARKVTEDILKYAFGNKEEAELIVRVPQLLAKYGNVDDERREKVPRETNKQQEPNSPGASTVTDTLAEAATPRHRGISILNEQAPLLRKYFNDTCIPHMKNYFISFLSQDKKIRHLNEKLRKASETDQLEITFTEMVSQQVLEDVPLLVLSAPNITFLEVMVHDLLKAAKQPYIFLDVEQWDDTVMKELALNKCDVVLLSNPRNAEKDETYLEMATFLNDLSEVRGTRVILLTTNEKTFEGDEDRMRSDCIAGILRKQEFYATYPESSKYISEACFENVLMECKRKALEESGIYLQGANLESFDDWDINAMLDVVDEESYLELCKFQKLEIGLQLKHTRGRYVKRWFRRGGKQQHNESHLITASEKIIVVTGSPGIGKSTLADRLQAMIKQRYKRQWVFRIDLPTVSEEITRMNVDDVLSDVKNLAPLCGLKAEGLDLVLFEKCMKEGRPFQVILVFDAMDEICEMDHDKLINLVQGLHDQTKVSRIYLLSRSVLKKKLEDNLRTAAYELLPFSKQDKEVFIEYYSKESAPNAIRCASDCTRQILLKALLVIGDDDTILSVPFYLRLFAGLEGCDVLEEMYPEVLKSVRTSSGSEMYLSVYELVIIYRYLTYRTEKKNEDIYKECVKDDDNILRKVLYDDHRILAMKAVFDDALCQQVLQEEERKNLQDGSDNNPMIKASKNMLKHGFLNGVHNGRPVFEPRGIAEYLAAQRLFSKVTSVTFGELHGLVFRMYGENHYKRVTKFLDSFGMKFKQLHFAVMDKNVASVKSRADEGYCDSTDELLRLPWHIAALHADEKTIAALSSAGVRYSPDEKDKFDATTLDYVHQQREWSRLLSMCHHSCGKDINRTGNVPSPETHRNAAIDRKDLEDWLQQEKPDCCPGEHGKARIYYVHSLAALGKLLQRCNENIGSNGVTSLRDVNKEQLDRTGIEHYTSSYHKHWNDIIEDSGAGITDNNGVASRSYGIECHCSAVVMCLPRYPAPASASQVICCPLEEQRTHSVHMWLAISQSCRQVENTPIIQQPEGNPGPKEEYSARSTDGRAIRHQAVDQRNDDDMGHRNHAAPGTSFRCIKNNTLRDSTESLPQTPENEARTNILYKALEKKDSVKPLVRAVETSTRVKIKIDYDAESIQDVEGALGSSKYGRADLKGETIHIAARRNDVEVLGTLAHELCHLALNFIYRNVGKPYLKTDRERATIYHRILDAVRDKRDEVDLLLREAFDTNSEEELIARVPHILAQYTDGDKLLQTQAHDLYAFFNDKVLPDILTYANKRSPTERIRAENRRLGHADQTEARQVLLEKALDYNELPDVPILVLKAQNIAVLEIMAYNAVKSAHQRYLFFRSAQWNYRVHDVLFSNQCELVLITHDQEGDTLNILESLIELNDLAGTKVIVLVEEDNATIVVEGLMKYRPLASVHKVEEVLDAHLDNVQEDSKRKILHTSQIRLQGSPNMLPLEDLLDLKVGSRVPDEVTGLMSCQFKEIDVGKPVPQHGEGASEYYVERKCRRGAGVDMQAISVSEHEVIVLYGSPLQKIAKHLWHDQVLSLYSPDDFLKYIFLEDPDEYDTVTKSKLYEGKVAYLIKFDETSETFKLMTTNGRFSRLPMKGEISCDEIDLMNISEKVVAVCGAPGTGKSSFALRLSSKIKAQDERQWVLYVNLPEVNRELSSLEVTSESEVAKDIAAICGVQKDGLESMLFQQSVNTGSPFQVTVIFDAFDEIEERCRGNVMFLAKALRRTEVRKTIIFSRNVFKEDIQDTLHTVAFELTSFSAEDRNAFLSMHIKPTSTRASTEMSPAPAWLNTLRDFLSDETLGNPLLLRFATELLQNKIPDDFLTLLEIPTSNTRNLKVLYTVLADYKYLIYRRQKRNENVSLSAVQIDSHALKERLYYEHELLAMKATLGDELSKKVLTEEELKVLQKGLEKVAKNRLRQGFVDGMVDDIPAFVSKGLALYFTASLLFRKVKASKVTSMAKTSSSVLQTMQDMYSRAFLQPCVIGDPSPGIWRTPEPLKDFIITHLKCNNELEEGTSEEGRANIECVLRFLDSFGAACCPIHTAIVNGEFDLSKNVTETDMNVLDELERSPLHLCVLYAVPEALRDIPYPKKLPGEDLLGMTPLTYADKTCALRHLNELCARYEDTSIKWDEQIPSIYENIRTGRCLQTSMLYQCIEMELERLLRVILRQFCLVNSATKTTLKGPELHEERQERIRIDAIRGTSGETPLFIAKTLKVFLLLDPYSDVKAVDKTGATLLHKNAREARIDIVNYLLLRCKVDCPDKKNKTPVDVAVRHGQYHVVELLLAHSNAEISVVFRLHSLPLVYREFQSELLKLLFPHLWSATVESRDWDAPMDLQKLKWDAVVHIIPYWEGRLLHIAPAPASTEEEETKEFGFLMQSHNECVQGYSEAPNDIATVLDLITRLLGTSASTAGTEDTIGHRGHKGVSPAYLTQSYREDAKHDFEKRRKKTTALRTRIRLLGASASTAGTEDTIGHRRHKGVSPAYLTQSYREDVEHDIEERKNKATALRAVKMLIIHFGVGDYEAFIDVVCRIDTERERFEKLLRPHFSIEAMVEFRRAFERVRSERPLKEGAYAARKSRKFVK